MMPREGDEGGEVARCLFAAQSHTLEALEFSDHLLDAGPTPVGRLASVSCALSRRPRRASGGP